MGQFSFVLSVAILSAILFFSSCSPAAPLELVIVGPENNSTVRTNLIKLAGSVSDPDTVLELNGSNISIDPDGRFSVYHQLSEGENQLIFSAVSGQRQVEKALTVTFLPAVAVFVHPPDFSQPFLTGPSIITGHVFPPRAEVRFNGQPVVVDDDGAFSATMQFKEGGNAIEAAAVLAGNEDSDYYGFSIEDGKPVIPPGQGLSDITSWHFEHSVSLRAGETFDLDTVVDAGKWSFIGIPKLVEFGFFPVSGEYAVDRILLPVGMEVEISPSSIEMYPNTVYPILIHIRTDRDTPPGKYWIMVNLNDEMRGWISIEVTE